jgi:hypothetical protein
MKANLRGTLLVCTVCVKLNYNNEERGHGAYHMKDGSFRDRKKSRCRSSVAAWLSETVLRGRGPGASGFESHRRGRIFSKE